jgi:hypothetical protein
MENPGFVSTEPGFFMHATKKGRPFFVGIAETVKTQCCPLVE